MREKEKIRCFYSERAFQRDVTHMGSNVALEDGDGKAHGDARIGRAGRKGKEGNKEMDEPSRPPDTARGEGKSDTYSTTAATCASTGAALRSKIACSLV